MATDRPASTLSRRDVFIGAVWAATVVGLLIGLSRIGFGVDYLNGSLGAVQIFQYGAYDPFRVYGGNAPYPPYFFSLFAPLAYSEVGAAVCLVLNVLAPVALVWALEGRKEDAYLLVLTPQSIANLALNNFQFVAVFGFALIVWAARHARPPWAGILTGLGFIGLTLKPNQFLLAPLVVLLRTPRYFFGGLGIALAFLAWSLLHYGMWVPVWLRYISTVTMASGELDNLLAVLRDLGLPVLAATGLQAGVLLAAVAYLGFGPRMDARAMFAIALAASNLSGAHANIISTLPLLAITFVLLPLRWVVALVVAGWLCALAVNLVTGQFFVGYAGLAPVVCLILLWRAGRLPWRSAVHA